MQLSIQRQHNWDATCCQLPVLTPVVTRGSAVNDAHCKEFTTTTKNAWLTNFKVTRRFTSGPLYLLIDLFP